MTKFTTIIILLSPCFLFAQSQDHSLMYKVVWKGDSIGYVSANEKVEDQTRELQLSSYTQFRFLMKFSLNYEYFTKYDNGKLVQSKTENKLNDKSRDYSTVEFQNNQYRIDCDGDVSYMTANIDYSVTNLYHKEPKGRNKIFSERFGEFLELEDIGESTYVLTKPSGRKNYYKYKNGICKEVKVINQFATIYFHRIP